MPTLHAFVISWPGQEDNAEHIAGDARGGADHVTVLHSCPDNRRPPERRDWVLMPDADFYGAKQRRKAIGRDVANDFAGRVHQQTPKVMPRIFRWRR